MTDRAQKCSGKPLFREPCQILDASNGEIFPDFNTSAEIAFIIPISSVATRCRFSPHYTEGECISAVERTYSYSGEMFIINIYNPLICLMCKGTI